MVEILVPISICVVLPVAIVLIVFLAAINSDNKRAKVLIKAIESNPGIDADKLAEALQKPKKTAREILNGRLLKGCIFSLAGLFCIIFSIVNLANAINFEADAAIGFMIFGGVAMAIGLSFLIVYFVTRKQVEESEE